MNRRDDARHDAAIALAVAIPGRWAERALCAQADPDAWFPDKGPARPGPDRHADLRVLPGRRPVPGLRTGWRRHLGRNRDRNLGRHHTTRTRPAPAAT